jgi:hypothetical protein
MTIDNYVRMVISPQKMILYKKASIFAKVMNHKFHINKNKASHGDWFIEEHNEGPAIYFNIAERGPFGNTFYPFGNKFRTMNELEVALEFATITAGRIER